MHWNNVRRARAIIAVTAITTSPLVAGIFTSSGLAAQERLPDAGTSHTAISFGETFTIRSSLLGETRRINVYEPPHGPVEALPVLYMPDGGIGEDFLHIAGLVQISVMNGTMRPFLLVGIENTQRRRDLTGPTTVASDREIAPETGGSAKFRDFIREELMPAISARFRTTDESAIVGESLAGLFIVETFLVERDLFDHYLAFDPSLWWDDGALVASAASRLRGALSREKTLYLASSSEPSIAPRVTALAEALASSAPASLRWHYEQMPEETHMTIYHPAALRAVRTLFTVEPSTR